MSSSIPDPIPDDATPEQLRHYVNYWRLEAQGYAFRWNLAKQYGDNLKAENERLRKAGDAMAVKINVHGINDKFTDSQKLVDDWSKAAKGVQS